LAASIVLLQELAVGIDLDGEQEGHFEDRPALAEILADALLLGERILGGGVVMGRVRLVVSFGRACAAWGECLESTVGSRWYCRHQHALSRYFRLSTHELRWITDRPERPPRHNDQSPGAFGPQPSACRRCQLTTQTAAYLTSTSRRRLQDPS
jgi:hypothetical protein